MVVLDKYQEEPMESSADADAPPSYDTIATSHGGSFSSRPTRSVDEKSPRQSASASPPRAGSSIQRDPRAGVSRPATESSWLSMLPFTSSRTSKQVRQTVLALIRDLVLNVESPDLLGSCSDACRTHGLDLSTILQSPSIEHHSAIYWGILNRRDTLLPSLLAHAAPLSQATISEIRLACLASSNQHLFQSLRCQREPFAKQVAPLSMVPGADALVLGATLSDEVSIREMDGEGAFIAEIQINLWQKRMRVSGRVSIEFIARGRIWSLTFFSPSSTARTATGMWQVALCLLEHSPPTFIDSRLVIDMSPPPSSAVQPNVLISLSPSPDDRNGPVAPSLPPPSPSNRSKSKSKAPHRIEVHLKSAFRLAYRASNTFVAALDAAFSSQRDWAPPHIEQWTDHDGNTFVNAIVIPLDNAAGAELLYANSPFIGNDGTLHVRLEARLGKPDPECVIC